MRNQLTDTPDLSSERLVTDDELAAVLSVSKRHIHVLRSRGVLIAVKLGGALRFPLQANLAAVLGGADEAGRRK